MRDPRHALLGRFGLLAAAAWAVVLVGCAHTPVMQPVSTARETAAPTALDRYVAKPDASFEYQLVRTFEGKATTGYVLEMTSQSWRSAEEVDRTLWKHWVTIVKPDKVKTDTALLLIGGGNNGGQPPRGGSVNLHRFARATNSVVAEVNMVPNQRLKFSDEKRSRTEDSLIAYTWVKYMQTGDEEWPLRLPMTKSAVRAMDAVQSFCASAEGGRTAIDSFVVAGASKRGWTTWTTGIVDRRVIAIVPIVIDLLHVVPSFEHHHAVLGFWAPAIDDYVDMRIMDWMGGKEFDALMAIVDPYSYLDRLTLPKLIMSACGDQFFLPDSSQFYRDDLKGPSYFRYVPNTGHGLNATAYDSVQSFFHAVVAGAEIPQYQWSFPDEQTIRVETASKPSSVKLWQATNPDARDFRISEIGEAYTATELEDQGGGVYLGRVEKPEKGWTAFMVELTFPGPGDPPFTFTSPVQIVPDVLPHPYERPKEFPKGFLTNQ